jgi:hypothetical protein
VLDVHEVIDKLSFVVVVIHGDGAGHFVVA